MDHYGIQKTLYTFVSHYFVSDCLAFSLPSSEWQLYFCEFCLPLIAHLCVERLHAAAGETQTWIWSAHTVTSATPPACQQLLLILWMKWNIIKPASGRFPSEPQRSSAQWYREKQNTCVCWEINVISLYGWAPMMRKLSFPHMHMGVVTTDVKSRHSLGRTSLGNWCCLIALGRPMNL